MTTLSIVIPALNEAANLPRVIASIPMETLAQDGWETEVLIVDNGSTDGTGEVARELGAKVVVAESRGYGNAYMAGFAAATGELIATGDADCTYPFDALPTLLSSLVEMRVEFLTTNRLLRTNRHAIKRSHLLANHVLSAVSRALFQNGIHDSQSGMWVFRKYILAKLSVSSPGMAFSQEIKNAATSAGFRYLEVPIEYRRRGGDQKLEAVRDGLANVWQLVRHRVWLSRADQRTSPPSRRRRHVMRRNLKVT